MQKLVNTSGVELKFVLAQDKQNEEKMHVFLAKPAFPSFEIELYQHHRGFLSKQELS